MNYTKKIAIIEKRKQSSATRADCINSTFDTINEAVDYLNSIVEEHEMDKISDLKIDCGDYTLEIVNADNYSEESDGSGWEILNGRASQASDRQIVYNT